MKSRAVSTVVASGVVFLTLTQAWSQAPGDSQTVPTPQVNGATDPNPPEKNAVPTNHYVPTEDSARTGFSGHIVDFLEDQKRIWTSPSQIRLSDANWLVPLGGITAGLFVTDRQFSASLNQNPATIKHYKNISDYGVAGLIGGSAGLYFLSFPTHNERWRETGFLAGEAALNSLVTVEAMKYSFGRERPYQGNGSGNFFHGGTSFPSEHAAAAWAIAGVFAHEYSGTIPSLFAYGAASAVSLSRIKARQHFPSDVLIGSVLGYLISQNVYRHRHNPEIGGAAWESPHEFVSDEKTRTPSFMGSPYVPLDSWIYPAMERLAALGYTKTASLGIRPWTRLECARLLGESVDLVSDDTPSEVQDLVRALNEEFGGESELQDGERNLHAQLESIYYRSVGISGTPLTDGYHFGQTLQGDFGRPFERGYNSAVGTSSWAVAGPLVFYARGEYQYAPSGPATSPAALDFISSVDYLPPNAPSLPIATTSRFRLLDAYVGLNLDNWQLTYGKQSLLWGPSVGDTMAFSDNAEPITMFRINRVSPFRLPGFLSLLGDIRFDYFFGQLSGQQFINNVGCCNGALDQGQYGRSLNSQPFLSGGRISFKFTQNLEFSMSKTTIYGGPGNPLTPKTFLQSTFGLHVNGEPLGDGRSVADFSYRIPRLRWITLYGEGFSEDEISPLNTPWKSVWQGGLYLAKVPRAPKIDLRLEGGFTSPTDFSTCNGCFFHNYQYVNGFTNNGQLMGSWVGRAAQGESIQSNYWLSSTKKIGIELKHRTIDRQFLPQGGNQNDFALNSDLLFKAGLRISATLQYESWQIPLLATRSQQNVAASVQLSFWPRVARR